MHFGVGKLATTWRFPFDGVIGVCWLQHHVLAQLVGAAPDEHLAAAAGGHIAERHHPHSIIPITTAQHVDDEG